MIRLACVVLLAAPLAAVAGGRSYNGEKTIDHDCTKEPEVSVNTGSATATFHGACEKIAINGSSSTITIDSVKKLAVTGSGNTITVDAADKIALTGSGNTVTYKKGVTAKKPKVSKLGRGNTVTQVK
jgi:hypothetical protein